MVSKKNIQKINSKKTSIDFLFLRFFQKIAIRISLA